jgi:hypothetical protein
MVLVLTISLPIIESHRIPRAFCQPRSPSSPRQSPGTDITVPKKPITGMTWSCLQYEEVQQRGSADGGGRLRFSPLGYSALFLSYQPGSFSKTLRSFTQPGIP